MKRHIIVCGCPRSGTSLMQHSLRMLKGGYVHGGEARFHHGAAKNHPEADWIATKRPGDYEIIQRILDAHEHTKAIVMIRDGRDVCTSKHPDNPNYLVKPGKWAWYVHTLTEWYQHYPPKRMLVVKYEGLVKYHTGVMQMVADFVGTQMEKTWLEVCADLDPEAKTVRAMHGVRPIDVEGIGRWKKPEHVERLHELVQVPEFTDELLAWGYETDKDWLTSHEAVVG